MRLVLLMPLALLHCADPASGRVMAPANPVQRALRSELVVVGKVTAIEKDAVEVAVPGSPGKVAYKVAVIKVEAALAGADNLTHVKVGFVPPPKADPANPPAPPVGGLGRAPVVPTEGAEGLFFLTKHPSGQFYTIGPMAPPIDAKAETYKADVEAIKKAVSILADPTKALKAEKTEDRYFAATVVLGKYRTAPDGVSTEVVKVPAEESQLILKALAEGDWSKAGPYTPTGMQAFYSLALTDRDGWTAPKLQPGDDPTKIFQTAFARWLAGPGKDYQVNRIAVKKK